MLEKCPRCGETPRRWGNYRDGIGVVHECNGIEVNRRVSWDSPDGEIDRVWAKYCEEVLYGITFVSLKS